MTRATTTSGNGGDRANESIGRYVHLVAGFTQEERPIGHRRVSGRGSGEAGCRRLVQSVKSCFRGFGGSSGMPVFETGGGHSRTSPLHRGPRGGGPYRHLVPRTRPFGIANGFSHLCRCSAAWLADFQQRYRLPLLRQQIPRHFMSRACGDLTAAPHHLSPKKR